METTNNTSAGAPTANGGVDSSSKAPCKASSASMCAILAPLASLIYWRDLYKSGAVLAVTLSVLVSLCFCSVISVLANFALLALLGSVGYRAFIFGKQTINKTQEPNPYAAFIDMDLSLSSDKVHAFADCFLAQFNCGVSYLQRVFLLQDLTESAKFGAYLYGLSYVGAWFNSLTIVILAVVAAFSLPKAYEANKAQVDQYLAIASDHCNQAMAKVKAIIPIGGGAAAKDKKTE